MARLGNNFRYLSKREDNKKGYVVQNQISVKFLSLFTQLLELKKVSIKDLAEAIIIFSKFKVFI